MGKTRCVDDNELNPPVWPKSVILINDTMSKEAILEATLHTQDNIDKNAVNVNDPTISGQIICGSERHFVEEERYAILFSTGTYENLDLEIGCHTQVAGLGARADDVNFIHCDHGPFCPALRKDAPTGNCAGFFLSIHFGMWRRTATPRPRKDNCGL
jgi:hypothetical protein